MAYTHTHLFVQCSIRIVQNLYQTGCKEMLIFLLWFSYRPQPHLILHTMYMLYKTQKKTTCSVTQLLGSCYTPGGSNLRAGQLGKQTDTAEPKQSEPGKLTRRQLVAGNNTGIAIELTCRCFCTFGSLCQFLLLWTSKQTSMKFIPKTCQAITSSLGGFQSLIGVSLAK